MAAFADLQTCRLAASIKINIRDPRCWEASRQAAAASGVSTQKAGSVPASEPAGTGQGRSHLADAGRDSPPNEQFRSYPRDLAGKQLSWGETNGIVTLPAAILGS